MNFLAKIFRRQVDYIPDLVTNNLKKHFVNAKNIEWGHYHDLFEASFYENDVEKIAKFDSKGNLVEYRINIPVPEIPSFVKINVDKDLEIMNCIKVFISDAINYEVIVRNKALVRYQLLLDANGEKLRFEKL